jgi:hypothetical protein
MAASSVPSEYPIRLEGRVKTFAAKLPIDSLADLSGGTLDGARVFLYCWVDQTRGQGAHVHYQSSHLASDPVDPALRHNGWFCMDMSLRDGDPDILKVAACMRMKDQETNNTRNATLAVSGTQLDRLLMGEEQTFTMVDQFVPGNFTEVVMRATNASDYANHPGAHPGAPRISLSRSSLWDIETVFRPVVTDNSNRILDILVSNKMKATKGGSGFLAGMTRSVPCFITLFLGTPAYVLMLAAGNGEGPSSPRARRTSARSPPTTRS